MIPNRAMHHNYVIQPKLTSDIQFLDSKTKFREMLPIDLVEEVKNENKWSIKLCTFFNKGCIYKVSCISKLLCKII